MIEILSKNVADKIAAGEVIERPASIIKELVENSIDAGAESVTIEIKKGGKEYIRVTDDGEGIRKADLRKAFYRHATSKISKAEDLKSLYTLGFRGEALASIAAVTRTEMITKTVEENIGSKILIHGGEVLYERSVGCPEGTSIICEDLFYNTPARKKFLKNDGAETSKIIDLVSRMALASAHVRFRLISNGKLIFATSGDGDLLHAITSVFNDRDYKELIPVNKSEGSLHVRGYISRPSLNRSSRRSQYFFVNGRVIESRLIGKGLDSAYKERLFQSRYPIAFLFLESDPGNIDVNIHPNKKQVRFNDEIAVIKLIQEAALEALTSREAIPDGRDSLDIKETSTDYEVAKNKDFAKQVRPNDHSYLNVENEDSYHNLEEIENNQVDIKSFLKSLREEEDQKREQEENKKKENSENGSDASHTKEVLPDFDIIPPPEPPLDFNDLQIQTILFGTYIGASDEDNFYLIDQHAAHERINYETFVKAYMKSEKHSQILLLPFTVDLPREIIALTDETLMESAPTRDGHQGDRSFSGLLNSFGFNIEPFGDTTYIVREIPFGIEQDEAERFVRYFIDEYYKGNFPDFRLAIDKLITKACKASIKAHDYIKKEEAEALIEALKNCKNPYSCPHGRPTFVRLSEYDIEKMFKRV